MNWMDRLERKIGKYAIPHITRYMVILSAVGYLLTYIGKGALLDIFGFNVSWQVWRFFTWILVPGASVDIFAILFFICALSWGESLEAMLGTFRMNVFWFGGIIVSDILGVIAYLTGYFLFGNGIRPTLSLYYIMISLLMAMALYMPDGEVRLYFVLPIKMKWMLVFELLYLGYCVFRTIQNAVQYMVPLMGKTMGTGYGVAIGIIYNTQIIAAVLNMFLFFLFSRIHISRKHKKRQREFKREFSAGNHGKGFAKHKCVICGRTEISNPELMFRYCSKCSGNKEYCEEHLYSHIHS